MNGRCRAKARGFRGRPGRPVFVGDGAGLGVDAPGAVPDVQQRRHRELQQRRHLFGIRQLLRGQGREAVPHPFDRILDVVAQGFGVLDDAFQVFAQRRDLPGLAQFLEADGLRSGAAGISRRMALRTKIGRCLCQTLGPTLQSTLGPTKGGVSHV